MNQVNKTIPVIGEVFEDGQFRGNTRGFVPEVTIEDGIKIGRYTLLDCDKDTFYIFLDTGEVGAFKKSDFESHVAAFFGLNF